MNGRARARAYTHTHTYEDENVCGVPHLLTKEDDHQDEDVADDAQDDNYGEDDWHEPGDDQIELSLTAGRGVIVSEVQVGEVIPLFISRDVQV